MEEKNVKMEEAQKVIENDKKERAEAFQKELMALCEKYKCRLEVGGIIIQPE